MGFFMKFFQRFLKFTQGETNAYLILIGLTLSVAIASLWVSYADPGITSKELHRYLLAFQEIETEAVTPQPMSQTRSIPIETSEITVETLIRLGVKPFLARRIEKMRSKGFRFETLRDFRKVWDMDSASLSAIAQHVSLKDTLKSFSHTRQQAPRSLELNSADSIELLELKAVGPAMARRIILYREKLGGFYRLEQLKEVWGISEDVLKINPGLRIDTTKIRKIKLGQATLEELAKHPYMGWKNAKVIKAFLTQHGNLNHCSQLLALVLPERERLSQVCIYLEFN